MRLMKRKTLSIAILTIIGGTSGTVVGQSIEPAKEGVEEVMVTGIRSALTNALVEKRSADNIKEVIQAEDIGKLPDQNLADVLENITGIQIDRSAGVGTAVQIRGTDANRIEINGVSTVSNGNDRSGISFEDLPAALIASLEVIKVPEAKTVEGSVGGTINLRTLRGLELKDRLTSVRLQTEHTDLADSYTPRVSGTFGDNWSTGAGEFGVVVSASYAQQEVASFDPRFDRDREVLPNSGRASAEDFPFLRTQFADQVLTRYDYETTNLTTSFQFAPNDDMKFYFDMTLNDQERAQKTARAFFSGIGSNGPVDNTTNTAFETVYLGRVDGPNGSLDLGEVQAVLQGVIGVGRVPNGAIDTNLRTTGITSSRLTESKVFALGGEWQMDRLKLEAEAAYSVSDNKTPGLNTTLDFINPRGPQPAQGRSIDNGVPVIFDASDLTLQFGIAPDLAETPTAAELLDPANYALQEVAIGLNTHDNDETALRIDGTYDTSDLLPFFSAIKTGARLNQTTSVRNNVNASSSFSITRTPGAANFAEDRFYRPRADLFADVVSPGPDNFNAADGRYLYIPDYLIVDPDKSFSNPETVIGALNAAIAQSNAANGVNYPSLSAPSVQLGSFFDIEETSTAVYLQGDYALDAGSVPIRGNLGLRWVNTEIESIGNNVENGQVTARSTSASYDFLLPRFNLVAELSDELIVRFGAAKDIRRPNFDDVSTSIAFGGNAGAIVFSGNPELVPEEVTSFDLSAEYYLSDASVISAGVFHKKRSNLFGDEVENPAEPRSSTGQIERDITAPCEAGGIYNPVANRNVWSSTTGTGICVPYGSKFNIPGHETQQGIELAFQYDLSEFEDSLGWASGFGFIGNYTYQEAGGSLDNFYNGIGDSNALNRVLGRTDTDQSTPTLADDTVMVRTKLLNLSENAYNATLFYDKNGISFRMRYTWRSSFETSELISFDLPRIVDERGQLNMSASYEINENVTVGIEGVNLIREDRTEWCVNEGALLCAQGLTDRKIVAGVTLDF